MSTPDLPVGCMQPGYFSDPANNWPPGFRSECCDPASPHFVFRKPTELAAKRILAASRAARETGAGWGKVTMSFAERGEAWMSGL